jgi:hypothetical protein
MQLTSLHVMFYLRMKEEETSFDITFNESFIDDTVL